MSELLKISVDLKLVPAISYPGLFFTHFCKKTTTIRPQHTILYLPL